MYKGLYRKEERGIHFVLLIARPPLKEALSINALRACVYIYIRQVSSFRAPTWWFIVLTVAAYHIQYTSLSSCQFFSRENGQNTYDMKMAANGY